RRADRPERAAGLAAPPSRVQRGAAGERAAPRSGAVAVKRLQRGVIFTLLYATRSLRKLVVASPWVASKLLRRGHEGMLWRIGEWRAWLAFERALDDVPAYSDFVLEQGGEVTVKRWKPDFSRVPVTTKENYVRRYAVEERCVGGQLPPRGVVIDESSGTSGEPSNWVRGPEERQDAR